MYFTFTMLDSPQESQKLWKNIGTFIWLILTRLLSTLINSKIPLYITQFYIKKYVLICFYFSVCVPCFCESNNLSVILQVLLEGDSRVSQRVFAEQSRQVSGA